MLAMMGLIAAVWALPQPAVAPQRGSAPMYEVARTDPLRKTLLDALRPVIEKDLGQPVQFVVTNLRVKGVWAFANVTPQTPSGKPIDFRRTRYASLIRDGVFDGPQTFALLKREGARWRVIAFAIGPTDAPFAGWPQEFGAPGELFAG